MPSLAQRGAEPAAQRVCPAALPGRAQQPRSAHRECGSPRLGHGTPAQRSRPGVRGEARAEPAPAERLAGLARRRAGCLAPEPE